MTGVIYYDALAYTHDRRCNYCGLKLDEKGGAFIYKEGNDDKENLYFCDYDCAEGFCRLNNMEDKK